MATIKHAYYTMNWSLGEMWDFEAHPYMEPIVRYIEPKIVRGMYLPCWKWMGRMQFFNRGKFNEYAYPTVNMPVNFLDLRQGRKVVYVHRFIAQTFWEMDDSEIVYRTCLHSDCVNPAHFAVSFRNDPEFA